MSHWENFAKNVFCGTSFQSADAARVPGVYLIVYVGWVVQVSTPLKHGTALYIVALGVRRGAMCLSQREVCAVLRRRRATCCVVAAADDGRQAGRSCRPRLADTTLEIRENRLENLKDCRMLNYVVSGMPGVSGPHKQWCCCVHRPPAVLVPLLPVHSLLPPSHVSVHLSIYLSIST